MIKSQLICLISSLGLLLLSFTTVSAQSCNVSILINDQTPNGGEVLCSGSGNYILRAEVSLMGVTGDVTGIEYTWFLNGEEVASFTNDPTYERPLNAGTGGNFTVTAAVMRNAMPDVVCSSGAVAVVILNSGSAPNLDFTPAEPIIECGQSGELLTAISSELTNEQLESVVWRFGGATGQIMGTGRTHLATESGTYRAEYDPPACRPLAFRERFVDAEDAPTANIVSDNNRTEFTSCIDAIVLDGSNSISGLEGDNTLFYTWSGPQGFNCGACNTATIEADLPGIYSLTVRNADQCTDGETFTIGVDDNLEFLITSQNQVFAFGDSVNFELETNPALGLADDCFVDWLVVDTTNIDSAIPIDMFQEGELVDLGLVKLENPNVQGQIILEVNGACNYCEASPTTITITIQPQAPTSDNLIIPELFSPNGDGINDEWNIRGKTGFIDLGNYDVKIYNRSGCEVYSGTLDIPWTGAEHTNAEYFYIIQNRVEAGEVYKGAVLLIGRQ